MDPISAAASVIGLLGAAAKVSEVLFKFIRNVKEAPKLARNVLMEVSDVSACLNQLQLYLQGTLSTSTSHEQLLMVEQLVVTLSNCVLIFSELEEMMDSLKPAGPMQPWRLAQWLLKEQAISALMVRMQQSKLSLSLMLTTLTCSSFRQAQSSASQLTALVQQVLENNLDISRRMANLEMQTLGQARSSAPTLTALSITRDDHSISTMRVTKDYKKHRSTLLRSGDNIKETGGDASALPAANENLDFGFTFDQDLHSSRPYVRAMRRNLVSSAASSSSTLHTTGWSCMSGVSLADVSAISVIRLPVSPQELWNGQQYIATEIDNSLAFQNAHATAIDDLDDDGDVSPSKYEFRSLEARKGIALYTCAQLIAQSSRLNLGDEQFKKVLSPVDRTSLKPKLILLLGTAMAGKSTVLQRLRMNQGFGLNDTERLRMRKSNIRGLIDVFSGAGMRYGMPMPAHIHKHLITLGFYSRENVNVWTDDCYAALLGLWSDSKLRRTIENGKDVVFNEDALYHLEDTIDLFYGKVVPDELLLAGCYKATVINDSNLDGRDLFCRVCEVGVRTAEYMNRPIASQDADGVIFVVSMTGYCQAVPGYFPKNQMLDSLDLFERTTQLDEFKFSPRVVLLNKLDLLAQRMRSDPIADYFPEYSGDSHPLAACRFFAAKFLELDSRLAGNLRIVIASAIDPYDLNCTIGELIPELFVEEFAFTEFIVFPDEEGKEARMGIGEVK